MGMIIPSTDPRNLSASSSVTISPFTIVFEKAGLSSVAHIMNAVILITVSFEKIKNHPVKVLTETNSIDRFFLVPIVVCT